MECFTVQRLKLDGTDSFVGILLYSLQGIFAVNRMAVTLSPTYLHDGVECSVSLCGSAWTCSVRSALSVRALRRRSGSGVNSREGPHGPGDPASNICYQRSSHMIHEIPGDAALQIQRTSCG